MRQEQVKATLSLLLKGVWCEATSPQSDDVAVLKQLQYFFFHPIY